MTVGLLPGLAAAGAALCVVALLAMWPALARMARWAAIGLVLAMAVAALLYLATGAGPARLVVPVGLAGIRPVLALDGISAFFLVALLPVGAAGLALGAPVGGVSVMLAGVVLALLAGEAGTLVLGAAVAVMAASVVLRGDGWPVAWVGWLAVPALAVALAVPDGDGRFAALRAQPPEGWAAAAMLGLAMAGGGALAGLAPLHGWIGRVAANGLAAACLRMLGLYVLVRVVFDLMGPGPAWWGVPLLVMGAIGAVRGAALAATGAGLREVLGGVAVAQSGLVALGLGMALAARGVDDGPAVALALGGALFGVLAFGWVQALWEAVAGAVEEGAGTQLLDRLGGLAHGMRITTIGALAGGLAGAMLPPGAGFSALWLLVQAAVTLPRGGGADWWVLGLVAVAALALAAALLGFAVLRVLGVAFLGRPRTPRGAAAEEVAPGGRWLILGLAVAVLGCGLVPGVVLTLAGPAVRMLGGVVPWDGLDGVAPLGLAALLALAGVAVVLGVRARGPAGHRVVPAWEGGQAPGPAWLPFGDPATQLGAEGFTGALGPLGRLGAAFPEVRMAAGRRVWGRVARSVLALPRRGGAGLVGAMVLVLLALHLVGAW